MGQQLDQFLRNLQAHGTPELDLTFRCPPSKAQHFGVAPHPADLGLVTLSKAVGSGATDVHLIGNNVACSLNYDDKSLRYGPGVFAQILKRGTLVPLNLSVNGRPLVPGFSRPTQRLRLKPSGRITSGFLDLLGPNQKGQVYLVDRGVSFNLGPLFGPIRVVAHVMPLRGAPWPSRLVIDEAVTSVVRDIWDQIRAIAGPKNSN